MTKFRLLGLKNSMLFANFIANVIGVAVVAFLIQGPLDVSSAEVRSLSLQIAIIFNPSVFILALVLTVIYESPIRRYLNLRYANLSFPAEIEEKARRRVINELFFLIALDLGLWLMAAIIHPVLYWAFDAGPHAVQLSFTLGVYTGMITTVAAFFILEHIFQKRLSPFFFPHGGLYATPKTIRVSIRIRLVALLLGTNLVPFIAILTTLYWASFIEGGPAQVLERLKSAIYINSILFIGAGIWFTILVSANLTHPLDDIIRVLKEITLGVFEKRVRVRSNDEIGYTGDVINEMTEGLKERDFIKETFGKYVTQEIRDEILSGRIPLNGELREVTVLFADLRNFTPMVESTRPEQVVRIINGYFKEMEMAIRQHHGLVLQYIGDEIEAVFGAPIYRSDHRSMAVNAALEMQSRLGALNQEHERLGLPPLSHGIGIHTGEVLAANIGSPDRLSYALVGDTVNLASRLQGLNKELGTEIILSLDTRSGLDDGISLKELPAVMVKGKSHPVEIFTSI